MFVIVRNGFKYLNYFMVQTARLHCYLCVLLFVFLGRNAYSDTNSHLKIYTAGTPVTTQPCKPLTQSIALMGGGADVKAVYPWLIRKASECGIYQKARPGNFLIIRSEGDGEYYSSMLDLAGVASVQTLVVPDHSSANDPKLDNYILNASVIWISGGDQRVYYDAWKGSRLLSLIKEKIRYANVPLGGASAGMMLLGNYIHAGEPDHILTSREALQDPYNPYMVLRRGFWPSTKEIYEDAPYRVFKKTIIDSHFDTRNRMGRTLTFLARNLADKWSIPYKGSPQFIPQSHAIAVDGETALLIEQNRAGEFLASIIINPRVTGSAYFINPTQFPLCAKNGKSLDSSCAGPLTFTHIQINRLIGTDTRSQNLFNLSQWKPLSNASSVNFERYEINIHSGRLYSLGNNGKIY